MTHFSKTWYHIKFLMSALCYCFDEPEIIQTSSYIAEKVFFLPISFLKFKPRGPRWTLNAHLILRMSLFKSFMLKKIQFEPAWALISINLGNHLPCLMGSEFKTPESIGSEEDFSTFPTHFRGSNPGTPREDPFSTLMPLLLKFSLRMHGL